MKWCVIEFLRDVNFPNFPMFKGERWSFQVAKKHETRLKNIKNGKRFEFAGGLCLAEDVKIVYEGHSDGFAIFETTKT